MSEGPPTPIPGASPAQRARLHWIVFGPALFAVGVAALFLAIGNPPLVIAFLLAALGFAVEAVLRVRSFALALEADGITATAGLVQRDRLEVAIAGLRSIAVRQGPGGRLLGYGTLVITSSSGGEATFRSVAAPYAFRLAVLRRLDDLQSRTTEVVTRPAGMS